MCLNKLSTDARRVPRVAIGGDWRDMMIERCHFKGICLRV